MRNNQAHAVIGALVFITLVARLSSALIGYAEGIDLSPGRITPGDWMPNPADHAINAVVDIVTLLGCVSIAALLPGLFFSGVRHQRVVEYSGRASSDAPPRHPVRMQASTGPPSA